MTGYLPGLVCGGCGWFVRRFPAALSAPCMCPERETIDYCPHCFRESPNPSPRGTSKKCGACGFEYVVSPPSQRSALAVVCKNFLDPASSGEPFQNPTTTERGNAGSNPEGSTVRQGCRTQRGAPSRKGQRSRGRSACEQG